MGEAGGWTPQWIGSGARRLYSALHLAPKGASGLGVVLVPPLLHEQFRSRRLVTQVAIRLAAAGISCLRFDFRGSGDSDGPGECMDLASMREDVGIAVAALRDAADADSVAALAFRGGALPLSAWLEAGGQAGRAVLWEPVVDGAAWIDELVEADAVELRSTARYPLRRGRPVESDQAQLMGFGISPRLRQDLSRVQVGSTAWPGCPGAWGVLRPGVQLPTLPLTRVFELPADAAHIGDSTRMDGALFVSPGLQRVVDALALALLQARPCMHPEPWVDDRVEARGA